MTAGFEGETAMAILKKKNRIASLDLEEQKQNKRTAILADKHRRPIISHPMAMETEKREKKTSYSVSASITGFFLNLNN